MEEWAYVFLGMLTAIVGIQQCKLSRMAAQIKQLEEKKHTPFAATEDADPVQV
jgi:hypothetical protein